MKALLRSLPVNLFNDLTFTLPESIVDNLSVEYFAEQKYTWQRHISFTVDISQTVIYFNMLLHFQINLADMAKYFSYLP